MKTTADTVFVGEISTSRKFTLRWSMKLVYPLLEKINH